MKIILLLPLLLTIVACASNDTYHYSNSCTFNDDDSQCTLEESPNNIAIFFDGTKNTPSDKTNIYKLYEIVSSESQGATNAMYIEGVGTEWYRTITGNLFGNGINPRLEESYRFVLDNYDTPDKSLYLFGFSRGAYNARILAGLLFTAGLPDTVGMNKNEVDNLVEDIVSAYLKKGTLSEKKKYIESINGFKQSHLAPDIKFLGVWDTVSALSLKVSNIDALGKVSNKYVDQICNIKQVAHAVSIDDNRGQRFTPELMTFPSMVHYCEIGAPDDSPVAGDYISQKVDEVWFSGAHSDVGGGYDVEDDETLSGVSLNWMLRKLASLDNPIVEDVSVPENPLANSHIGEDSLPLSLYLNYGRILPDFSKKIHPNLGTLKLHSSVLHKIKHIPRTFREFAFVEDSVAKYDNYGNCFEKVALENLDEYNEPRKADFTLNYKPENGAKCFEIVEQDLYSY